MVILGLGSNTGDRGAHLRSALRALVPLLSAMRSSRVLESNALLPEGAPASWNQPFLNMAVAGDCTLTPEALLAEIKSIERALGRVPAGRWAPRIIDIDILAMGEQTLESPVLQLPHPELIHRDFALLPLADLAPGWIYPLAGPYFGKTALEIAAMRGYALGGNLRDTGLELHAA